MYGMVVCAALLIQCVSGFTIQEQESKYFSHPKDRNGGTSPRIIGGEVVKPHSYPFQAELIIYKGTGTWFCGGSLISPNQVLTAAHCLKMNPDYIVVGLGRHNITDPLVNEPGSTMIQTSSYVYHKDWNGEKFVNDVAIVRLPENVTFTEYIQPVKLATGSNKYAGEKATLIGWGETEFVDDQSSVLKSVNATIMTNSDCANTNRQFKEILRTSHICTSGAGIVGVCSGDSGGPLIVDGVQVGITSFGTTLCTVGYPSVFTRVTEFEDWIAREGQDDPDGAPGAANTISGHLGAIALVGLCFSYILN